MIKTYQGSCHCSAVGFEVDADIDHLRVCDCSVCPKRGAVICRVPADALRLLTSLSDLSVYRWGSQTVADYFCPICGILPLQKSSRSTAEEYAAGVQPFDGWAVNTMRPRISGTLGKPRRMAVTRRAADSFCSVYRTRRGKRGLQPGQKRVAARSPEPAGVGADRLSGSVMTKTYVGPAIRFEISMQDRLTMIADVANTGVAHQFATGDRVWLRWAPEAATVLVD
jgi:hypothetical protein